MLQALIDAAKQELLSNHQRITYMRTRAGLLPDDSADDGDALTSFTAALSEWDRQAGSRHNEGVANKRETKTDNHQAVCACVMVH